MNKNRKAFVAANWKMNVLPSKAVQLAEDIIEACGNLHVDVVIAPPFTHLSLMKQLIFNNFSLAAQNVHFEDYGAHTGSVSVPMLKDLNVEYVILGHSEIREANHLENSLLPMKINACLKADLSIIYCCGEPKEEREKQNEKQYVKRQLDENFSQLIEWNSEKIIIAYEPIWAIGTGLTASSEQADEMHAFIRNWIGKKYGDKNARETRILYGGSVKSSNAKELAMKENIDGALVGGASLKAEEFSLIVRGFKG
ncbi:MAG: triose-phosphate isomerase [Saprospiraceae bacterium]|nr:triose-phosphate isomerase [Saprospiraceae bacterium]